MSSPIIGLSTGRTLPHGVQGGEASTPLSYINAVITAGGIPVLIPAGLSKEKLAEVLTRIDGLILIGGGDIDPALFNGPAHQRVYGIDPERDFLDLNLARLAAETDKPFLGICRGIQVVNVALGGSLYTDLADQKEAALRHDYYPDIPRNHLAHGVQVDAHSKLGKILGGSSFEVNSLHHQGLDAIAPALKVTAHAPDGLVEAVELPDHPFGLGVQWHPEWLQEHAPQRAIFSALIAAAQK